MQLSTIVPFGRSKAEYELIFNLTPEDCQKKILGCGDGPASFNAEMTALGYDVISFDPIYQFTGQEIKGRFDAVIDLIISQVIASPDDWVWGYHQSPQHLKKNRLLVMERFLTDYEQGKQDNRYLIAELPVLPFGHQSFELALCSHFLFLYSQHLSYDFHLQSILELLRVAQEVRIFPLLTLNLQLSPYLVEIVSFLSSQGYLYKVETVSYELQKGGNQMLSIFTKG